MTSAWQRVLGDRPWDLESGRPGSWASQFCSGIRYCRLLLPEAILTTDFVHTKAVHCLFKMKNESKCFFSALLIAQIPIWDVFPVNKDNLLSVVLCLKYSDTSKSEGWGNVFSFFTAQSLSGNASLWIWKELRDIITNGLIIMWRILPWDSSPVSTDTETLWTLWKTNKCYALLILNALAIWCLLY